MDEIDVKTGYDPIRLQIDIIKADITRMKNHVDNKRVSEHAKLAIHKSLKELKELRDKSSTK
mgnify:CR=1 FL=1